MIIGKFAKFSRTLFKIKFIYLSEMQSFLMIGIFFRFQLILHEFNCSKTLCSTSQIKQWWMEKHACSSNPEPLRQHTSDLSREQGIIAVLSFFKCALYKRVHCLIFAYHGQHKRFYSRVESSFFYISKGFFQRKMRMQ